MQACIVYAFLAWDISYVIRLPSLRNFVQTEDIQLPESHSLADRGSIIAPGQSLCTTVTIKRTASELGSLCMQIPGIMMNAFSYRSGFHTGFFA